MEPLFGWIHLSDLHVGHGDIGYRGEQRLVLSVLARDIKTQVSEISRSIKKPGWRPDILLVSGDIAFSANSRSPTEYEQAADLLLTIAREVGIPQTEVLMVPGNHDIYRLAREDNRDAFRLIQNLRTGEDSIDDALASPSDRDHLLTRAASFLEFAEKINPVHVGLRSESEAFSWRRSYVRSGMEIRVVGFNSALLCNDDADLKRLAIGIRALASAFERNRESPTNITLAVTHHPFEWLRNEQSVRSWITNNARIHLYGHIHDQKTESFRSGGSDPFLKIVAGAAHNDHTSPGVGSHGYNIGLLVGSRRGVEARIWPRIWVDDRKSFRLDITNVKDRMDYAEHVILEKLPESELPEPMPTAGLSSSPARFGSIAAIVDLPAAEVDSFCIRGSQLQSSFIPPRSELLRISVKTTSGYVPATGTGPSKYVPADNSVYIVRDPIRPFEIQIGGRRMSRPGADPGTITDVDGITPESLRIMYPIMADESLKWLRMIFADLSTSPEVLSEIYQKDPDRNIRRMAARNPSAPDGVKATECLFCDREFLGIRMKPFENSKALKHFRGLANIFCNDYPYGPLFHYIVMPAAAVHSWEGISEHHLLNMNLLARDFFLEDAARLNGAAGMRIGLNSTIRHLVMGKRTHSSAGASIAHVHKQIWGMLPGSVNLGDHLRDICRIFAARTPTIDYLERYLGVLHEARLVLWEDPKKLVTLYVPFGQTSVHELQVMVSRKGVGDYLSLSDEEIAALSRAELIVTRLYQRMGVQSFNEVLLSQPFNSKEPTVRLVLTFITREVDIAVSELNLLYVVDKLPEQTRDEVAPHLEAVLAELT